MWEEWPSSYKQTDWLARREMVRAVLAYLFVTACVSFTLSGIFRVGTLHSTLQRIVFVLFLFLFLPNEQNTTIT